MKFFNPSWAGRQEGLNTKSLIYYSLCLLEADEAGTTAADELQQWCDDAPKTLDDYMKLNSALKYILPTRWKEVGPKGERYRGWRMENPDAEESSSVAGSCVAAGSWRLREWDEKLVEQVRCPSGDGHAAVTDETIKVQEKQQTYAEAARRNDIAAWASDEAVEAGTLVYILQHETDLEREKAAKGDFAQV